MTFRGNSTTSPRTSANPRTWRSRIPRSCTICKALFLIEAAKYNVLPIDSSFADRADPALRPNFNPRQDGLHILPGHDPHP